MQAFTRRGLLRGIAALGCSAAAHPLTTTVTFAQAPWDARLVVIILRGGMDGLDVIRPVGDPDYARHRGAIAGDGLPLSGFWALHPALRPLLPLWNGGELAFAQAVSTPYRKKRSHFDGQDLLEAGTGNDVALKSVRDGWLNRMLQTVPGLDAETAFAIGREDMKILAGAAEVLRWSPEAQLRLSPQAELLLEHIYADDPLFASASSDAMRLAQEISLEREEEGGDMVMEMAMQGGGDKATKAVAAFAADRLNRDTRIAAFSLTGWDTHRRQKPEMRRALDRLSQTILTLRQGLGGNWSKTMVLAMTEFGRTVALNGTQGTDHGTGGALLMAGGALRGGQVFGDWPGLTEAALFERRDLMPTADVRSYAAWAMRGLFGIERSALEGAIFPGLDMGEDPGIVL